VQVSGAAEINGPPDTPPPPPLQRIPVSRTVSHRQFDRAGAIGRTLRFPAAKPDVLPREKWAALDLSRPVTSLGRTPNSQVRRNALLAMQLWYQWHVAVASTPGGSFWRQHTRRFRAGVRLVALFVAAAAVGFLTWQCHVR
jgi:hypothetical protein